MQQKNYENIWDDIEKRLKKITDEHPDDEEPTIEEAIKNEEERIQEDIRKQKVYSEARLQKAGFGKREISSCIDKIATCREGLDFVVFGGKHIKGISAGDGSADSGTEEMLEQIKQGNIVILYGACGSGKTTTACQLALEFDKPNMRYMRLFDLMTAIQGSWKKESSDSQNSILNDIKNSRLLIIDEFQDGIVTAGQSTWRDLALTSIIDYRYSNLLPTVIITNVTLKEMKAKLTPSVYDRFKQTAKSFFIGNESLRNKNT